ncbi:hypothetical protein PW52_03770 [Tamlana sedimentorum]|uniref:O-antigen ligase-related domain-containing protein n=1 Tax=Neotamlana sedimentorum TaxID=1435349 RepID=A0A0D7WC82_9FLAO|nr:O-antigen ligase family protein [Tamlana sedimentorum]KJD36765.1 hypothetical protein PW52_03770 [Tamlana sedimentorum]
MKNLEEKSNKAYSVFLVLILSTLMFREFNTILILFFAFFNILFRKHFNITKKTLVFTLLIALPFLLDLFFFWNNDSFLAAIKTTEKRVTLLLFPLMVVGYYKKIDFISLLKKVTTLTSIILVVLFIRYVIVYNETFSKYLKGIDLWELGYSFCNSFGNHAPAFNMQISFIALSSFYLFFKLKKKIFGFIFLFLFVAVLYINTRIAIVNTILCSVFILVYELINKSRNRKLLVRSVLILSSVIFILVFLFVTIFPRLVKKFTTDSFSNMDKIGKIDELERPETKHGSLVLRLSIWKGSLELAREKIWFGYGASDGKRELINYFEKTNQKHLAKWKFPVHNQYLDFLLKFGIFGLVSVFIYIGFIGYLGFKLENSLVISFFIVFFISNLTDDFLIRYDGIVFSSLWISIFANQFKYKVING